MYRDIDRYELYKFTGTVYRICYFSDNAPICLAWAEAWTLQIEGRDPLRLWSWQWASVRSHDLSEAVSVAIVTVAMAETQLQRVVADSQWQQVVEVETDPVATDQVNR